MTDPARPEDLPPPGDVLSARSDGVRRSRGSRSGDSRAGAGADPRPAVAVAGLALALLGLCMGLGPSVPRAGLWLLFLPLLGLPLSLGGAALGYVARARALRDDEPLGWGTAALGTGVAATLLCAAWTAVLLYVGFGTPRPQLRRQLAPVPASPAARAPASAPALPGAC